MSHFTKIKTKINSKVYLKKAMSRMGMPLIDGTFNIYGIKAELALEAAPSKVGFAQQQDKTYSMVGDFYYAPLPAKNYYNKAQKFTTDLNVNYAVVQTTDELEKHNFFCTKNQEAQVGSNGKIQMEFVNWN